jgi:hypothetical protein
MSVQGILDAIDESHAWDDNTRERAIGDAALAHAREMGWVPEAEAHDIAIAHAKLSEGIDRAYQARIDTLEAAIKRLIVANDGTAGEWTSQRMVRVERAIAELRGLVIR